MFLEFLKHYVFSKRAGSLVRWIGWICFVGSVFSVAALVVVISVMQGFGYGMRSRLLAVEPHLIVKRDVGQMLPEDIAKIEVLTKGKAYGIEEQDILIRTIDGFYSGAKAQGVESQVLKHIMTNLEKLSQKSTYSLQTEISVREFQADSYRLEKGEVAIGVDLANSIGVFPGDELTAISPESLLLPKGEAPKYEKLKVKAVLRMNVPQLDSQLIFYGVGKSLKNLRYSGPAERFVQVELTDPVNYEVAQTALQRAGYSVQTWKDRNSALFYSLKVEKLLITLCLGIAFLVGSFSVVTLLVLLCTQKRFDIGMLQVMGMTTEKVKKLFHGIGMGLVTTGMFFGFILGSVICWWLDTFKIIELPNFYYDRSLPVEFDFKTSATVVLIVLIFSYVSTRAAIQSTLSAKLSEILRARRS